MVGSAVPAIPARQTAVSSIIPRVCQYSLKPAPTASNTVAVWWGGFETHPYRCASAVLDEGAVAQLADGGLKLGLGVHHDGTIPGDRLLDRLAPYPHGADALLVRPPPDLVAAV